MGYALSHAMCVVPTANAGHIAYRRLGFTVQEGGRHTIGTQSSVVPLEQGYLELISIWDSAGARQSPRRRAIVDYIDREAGGLIGFALRTETIQDDVERLTDAGLAYGGPIGARRLTANGDPLNWQVLRPTPQPCPALLPILVTGDQAVESFPGHENSITHLSAISVVTGDAPGPIGGGLVESYAVLLDAEPDGTMPRPDLGAESTIFDTAGLRVEILTPTGDGVAQRALQRQGPGPFELEFTASDLDAVARPLGLRATDGALTIPAVLACGVRMRVINANNR